MASSAPRRPSCCPRASSADPRASGSSFGRGYRRTRQAACADACACRDEKRRSHRPHRRRRRAALAVQRAALVVCERHFAEATRDCRQLTELVESQPQAARDKAQALSQALVNKMAGSGELCIRLLTEAAGDKAAAHAVNVTLISLLMGRTFGFVEADMLDLGVGALLHDVGKLDLAPRLRHRDDQMPGTDATLYEEHVALGVAHARRMGLAPGATLVIAQHHEHADGSGFPRGLRGERMTPASCIVALVNRYDNPC